MSLFAELAADGDQEGRHRGADLGVVLVLGVIRARTGLRLPPLGRWAGSRTSPRRLSRMPVARPGRPDLL
ncbi:MAG: hypothetical protein ACLP53_06660 [Isosphaeraceae bacterium]